MSTARKKPSRSPQKEARRALYNEWARTLNALDNIVMSEPEPGSVLNQLAEQDVEADLRFVLGTLVVHSTQFLRAAIMMLEAADNGRLTHWPVAPLARSGLLGLSKAMVIASELCRSFRSLGPALQHKHDSLVDTFLEQDRNAKFDPTAQSSQSWLAFGRTATVEKLNALRGFLDETLKPVDTAKGVAPSHKLVGDGAWIDFAQRVCAELPPVTGLRPSEDPYHLQWAWHRGSVVTHVAMSATATKETLRYEGLSAKHAEALVRHAVELARACVFPMEGVWIAAASPNSFKFGKNQQLPKSPTYPDLPNVDG